MIETPASAVLAAQLAREADFFSIGTNDLTQYTLAMDRGHAQLAPQIDAFIPAVLSADRAGRRRAAAHGKPVGGVRRLAADLLAAPLLIGRHARVVDGAAAPSRMKDRAAHWICKSPPPLAEEALATGSADARSVPSPRNI